MDRDGVIGLGKMGLPIAMNLMSRGFHVTGYRRSGSPEFVTAGGTVAASAAEVAAQADVIVSIVPTAEDVGAAVWDGLVLKANNALPFVPWPAWRWAAASAGSPASTA